MHVREIPTQMVEQRRFLRDRAEQLMLQSAADDGVEDRVLAVRHRRDFHDMPLGGLAVVLRELAERTFHLAHLRQEAAFDHHLGVGRHADLAGDAFHHRQRPALQRAGDLQLVEVERRDRLRGEQRQRIDADDDRGVERLAALLGHIEERVGVARQQQHAEPVRPGELAAMDRDVLLSGLRIAHDHQAGADVGPAVVLVVGRQRQLPHQIDVAMRRCPARERILFPATGSG